MNRTKTTYSTTGACDENLNGTKRAERNSISLSENVRALPNVHLMFRALVYEYAISIEEFQLCTFPLLLCSVLVQLYSERCVLKGIFHEVAIGAHEQIVACSIHVLKLKIFIFVVCKRFYHMFFQCNSYTMKVSTSIRTESEHRSCFPKMHAYLPIFSFPNDLCYCTEGWDPVALAILLIPPCFK